MREGNKQKTYTNSAVYEKERNVHEVCQNDVYPFVTENEWRYFNLFFFSFLLLKWHLTDGRIETRNDMDERQIQTVGGDKNEAQHSQAGHKNKNTVNIAWERERIKVKTERMRDRRFRKSSH